MTIILAMHCYYNATYILFVAVIYERQNLEL